MRASQRLEALAVTAALQIFGALPFETASALGGGIARLIGPRLAISRRARENLMRALPELDEPARAAAIRAVWDNLGRVAAEFPHLPHLPAPGPGSAIPVEGMQHVEAARGLGRPIFFFSAHFGNWELLVPAARACGLETVVVYRAANNPLVEARIAALRRRLGVETIPKGPAGARRIVAALREGKSLAMLIDQKMNDGIAVPFFGRDAMTAPALAELALRYDATILPARVLRQGGTRFKVVVDPPVSPVRSGDRPADVAATMTRVNAIVERWIREDPGLWFWLHRRWPE